MQAFIEILRPIEGDFPDAIDDCETGWVYKERMIKVKGTPEMFQEPGSRLCCSTSLWWF